MNEDETKTYHRLQRKFLTAFGLFGVYSLVFGFLVVFNTLAGDGMGFWSWTALVVWALLAVFRLRAFIVGMIDAAEFKKAVANKPVEAEE